MKKVIFVVALFLLSVTQTIYAACNSFSCGQSGGTCINGECVPSKPKPTPTPDPTTSPIPVSATAALVQIAKLHCVPGELCVFVIQPPDFLGKLIIPIVPKK